MDRLGDQLLAGAAFAVDVDGRVAPRDAGDDVEHLLHLVASHYHIGRVVFLLEEPFQAVDLDGEPAVFEGLFDMGEKIRGLKGFVR